MLIPQLRTNNKQSMVADLNLMLFCALLHQQIELKDGSQVEVYEHGMTLSIVALRGSLPEQWVVEFRWAVVVDPAK